MSLSRQFGNWLHHGGKVYVFCYDVVKRHKHGICVNNEARTISEKFLEISRLNNLPNELIREILDESKQYLPRKFDEMSGKFRFRPKFVVQPRISSTGVGNTIEQ